MTSVSNLRRTWADWSPFAIYAWLIALVVVPNLLLLFASFLKSSGGVLVYEPTLQNYAKVLSSVTVWTLIFRTLVTALVAAFVASLVAYPLAYFVSRYTKRWKTLAVMLVVVPLWISLLMRVFAWRVILGENGVMNSALVWSGLLDKPSNAFLYSPFAVIITLAYMAMPYVFVSSYTALERIPQSLIEASADSGANGWSSFWRVIWPLSREGLAIGFCLAFLLAVGDYLTPSMVGGLNGTMLGMVIASQFGLAGNWPLGSAQAIVLMVLVGILLALVFFLAKTRGIIQSVDAGAGAALRRPRNLKQWIMRYGLYVAVGLPYIFLYAPIFIIAAFSFNDSTVQTLPFSGFTWKWYAALFNDTKLITAFQRTLLVGSLTTLISVVFGVGFAMIFAYRKVRGAGFVQNTLAAPVAMPGIVLGISLAIAAQLAGIPSGLGRLVLGHATFVMPVVMLIVLNRLKQLDPSFVQASLDLGATPLQTFRHVLLPIISSAIVGGALLGFTLSVDEVIVTLFLTGINPTLPVHVWNQMRFGFTPSVNAIFTLIGGLSIVLIVMGMAVANRSPIKSHTSA